MGQNGHEFTGALRSRQSVKCWAEGETTVIEIGNTELRMHYTDALKLQQWIRMAAKQAKMNAGDISRHWSAIAVLDDASRD